ncbi:MAG: mechanosensitive ion channel domain-containing protein, partial [Nannocystaceae bacterium]
MRQSTRLAGLISILVLLTAIGLLSWSLLFDRDLQPWAERLSTEWSAKLLWPLGRTLLILALFSVALWYFGRLRRAFLPRIEGRLMSLASLEEHGAVLQRIFRELPDLLNLAITYALADFATDALSLPASPRWVLLTLWIIPLVASAARFSVMTSQLLLDVLAGLVDRFTLRTAARPYYEQVVRLLPLARRVLEAMVYIAAAMVVVQRFDTLELVAPYGPTAIELVAVFFFGRVFAELIAVLAFEVLTRWGIPEEAESSEAGIEQEVRFEEIRARRVTLATLVKSLSRFSIYVGMVMVMLVVIGVDPVPLLAGLGVAGFAVGLGSQKIIQDIISGFFMLMEDQMLVGDYVRVGDAEGVVEELLLRVTRIRDRFGRVHTLCNGDVGNVINYSRGW